MDHAEGYIAWFQLRSRPVQSSTIINVSGMHSVQRLMEQKLSIHHCLYYMLMNYISDPVAGGV